MADDVDHVVRRPDGAAVAHDVVGDGPPVLFVHGLTSHRGSWDPVTDRLRETFTCIRVDLRGHGASSPAADYGMPAIVGDLQAVVDAVGLGPPAVVGHSLGATAAALFAAHYPARAAVLVDQSLRIGSFADLARGIAARIRVAGTSEPLMDLERALGLGPYRGEAVLHERLRTFPPAVVLGMWETLLSTPPEQLDALMAEALSRIAVPLLVLHGTPVADGYTAWLSAAAPAAQIEVWEGQGHFLHLVHPDRFAARVRVLLT